LLTVFAGGPHCLWSLKKSRWSPPLGASVAMKIGKNRLEAKKSYTNQSGGVLILQKTLDHSAHSLFLHPSKNL
jgi:hypothetical protein